ncbi:MAG: DNRLRE domain-containing protein [Patescibacteria group bacterium]
MKRKSKFRKILRIVELTVIVVGIVSTLILIKNPPKYVSKAFDGSVTFNLTADTSTVKTNSELKLNVALNPLNNPVSVLELGLNYDPKVLEYSGQMEVGTMLPVQIGLPKVENLDNVSNTLKITLIAKCDTNGCLPALATDNLISVKFKALTPNANTTISVSPITKVLSAKNTTINSDTLQFTANAAQIALSSTGTTPPPTSTDTTGTLKPVADAYVKEAYPTKNYSEENVIAASNYETRNTQSAYMKFDLTKVTSSISSAKLKFVPKLSRTVTKTIKIDSNTSWLEDTINWKIQPDVGLTIGTFTGKVEAETPIYVNLDSSALAAFAGKIVTIKIDNVDGDRSTLQVYSREESGKEPTLIFGEGVTSSGELPLIEDTYVQSESDRVNNNYGQEAVLIASSYESNNKKTAYLKFDASSIAGKTIKKATLYLTATMARTVDKQVRLIANSTWSEDSMTYINKPQNGEIIGVINYLKTELKPDVPFGITLNTSKLSRASNGQISLVIDNSTNANTLSVYSKDSPKVEYRPKLIIETN